MWVPRDLALKLVYFLLENVEKSLSNGALPADLDVWDECAVRALIIRLLPSGLFGAGFPRHLVQTANIRQVRIEPSVVIREATPAEFELPLPQHMVRLLGLGGGGSRRVGPQARVARRC